MVGARALERRALTPSEFIGLRIWTSPVQLLVPPASSYVAELEPWQNTGAAPSRIFGFMTFRRRRRAAASCDQTVVVRSEHPAGDSAGLTGSPTACQATTTPCDMLVARTGTKAQTAN